MLQLRKTYLGDNTRLDARTCACLTAWGIWLFGKFVSETTFESAETVTHITIGCALVMLFFLEITRGEKYTRFDFLVGTIFVLFMAGALISESTRLVQTILVLYFMRHVNFRTASLATALFLLLFIFGQQCLFFVDFLKDTLVGINGLRPRSSLGFLWPSRPGNYFSAIVLAYICAKEQHCSRGVLVGCLVIAMVIFAITDARSPMLFTVLLVLLWFVVRENSCNTNKRWVVTAATLTP